MSAHHKTDVLRFVQIPTMEPSEVCDQEYRWRARSFRVFLTSMLLLLMPLYGSAAPRAPQRGELIGRCEDQTGDSLSENLRGEDCTPAWSEELQNEYQDHDAAEWWQRFSIGPQAPSEQEWRFLYRHGERRPLWGY